MKVENVITLERILSGIKINKVQDKEAKSALLKDYLAVRKIAKLYDADKQEIISKFQADWADALKDKSKQGAEFDTAVHDANESIRALEAVDHVLYDKAPIEFIKVKAELLYDADLWADDILLAQIPGSIDFLVENGVAE